MGTLIQENATCHPGSIKKLGSVTAELVKFNESYHQMCQMMTSVLRGENAVDEQLKTCIEKACSSVMNVACKFGRLCTFSHEMNASSVKERKLDKKRPQLLVSEIDLAANSLLDFIEYLQNEKRDSSSADHSEKIKASTDVDSATWCGRGVKKIVYTLQGTASTSEESSPGAVRWV